MALSEDILTPEEEFDLGVLNHFKTDSPRSVFLKLDKMSDASRELILESLDDVDLMLSSEVKNLIAKIIGRDKVPKYDHDRWAVIFVLAESATIYHGENKEVIAAINRATGRNFSVPAKLINWQVFAQKAEELLHIRENYYEVISFRRVKEIQLYAKSFLNTINTPERLEQVWQATKLAMQQVDTGLEVKEFNREEFIRQLMPEFYPAPPVKDEVKEALKVWGFLPQSNIDRLVGSRLRFDLVNTILSGWQAINIIRDQWKASNQKPTDFAKLTDVIRSEAKMANKTLDLKDSIATKLVDLEDNQK